MITQTKYPTGSYSEMTSDWNSLVDLLSFRANSQPGKQAYRFLLDGEIEEASLTFAELDQKARSIAVKLQSLGAYGERVLLLYPSGLDYIAAFFGCLYAGAIAVPAYPPRLNQSVNRLLSIVASAQPIIALSNEAILARARTLFGGTSELKSLTLLSTSNIDCHLSEGWQKPDIESDTIAFLQYTSGSTSLPKGVIVSHGNLLHNERLIQSVFQQAEQSIIVGWLPLYHDMGLIGNVLQSLYVGATCVLMPPTTFLQRPFNWLQAISSYKATTSGGPNFAYELCIRKIRPEQRAMLDLKSWSVAFNGAEPIRAETMERFASAFEPCGFRYEAFHPCYGLAEATLMVSGRSKTDRPVIRTICDEALKHNGLSECSAGSKTARALVGCGAASADQKILIVDPESLTESLPRRIGEIWVSGPSIARGYWNRVEDTERTFGSRLSDTGEGPFLRTGDLGCIDGGELLVTGRLKDLVIVRGINHYPQDLELTVERSHQSLRVGCGAAFSIEVDGEERLALVQEVDHHHQSNAEEAINNIRRAIMAHHEIEPYEIALIKAGTIPKTSSGKIQRQLCKTRFLEDAFELVAQWRESPGARADQQPSSAPLKNAEQIELWLVSELAARLRIDATKVDVTRPIFAYGMDSLVAVDFIHAVETRLGLSLPMAGLLESISIEQIVTKAIKHQKEAGQTFNPVIHPVQDYPLKYPLSRAQQGLWFLYQLEPESPAYNIAKAVSIHNELNVPALQRAFQLLIDRHPCLRTILTVSGDEPVQMVSEHGKLHFLHEDAADWNEEFLNHRLAQESSRAFKLEDGPLLRICLFTRSPGQHILLFVIHHIIADFWSLALLVRELGILYEAENTGVRGMLDPLPAQYVDYIHWQERMLAGPDAKPLRLYWEKKLSGELPALSLHTDRSRPAIQTYRGSSRFFRFSPRLTRGIKALSCTYGTTLYMTLLASFQVLLHRYTGQEDVLVGTPTAGRCKAEFANVVGMFVNPVVMRADLSGDTAFADFLAQVRRTVLDAFEHQDYPLTLLIEKLQPARDPSRSPLFQIMFSFQKSHLMGGLDLAPLAIGENGARMRLGELELESVELEQQVAQFDLTLTLAETGEELQGSLQFNTDLFDASTISRMAGHFESLFESIIDNPNERISAFPMLTEAERYQLQVGWNETAAEYAQELCIHEQFEIQAELTPDAVAISFREEEITYGELNKKANRTAHRLRALGVGPDVCVGVYVERSIEMVVGLLGILKAGGAYVPLDPTFPVDRLVLMMNDAQLRVLLTQERLTQKLPSHNACIVCLDDLRIADPPLPELNSIAGVCSENLAYVIYTSGSTGMPKGVMVTHRSVSSFFSAMDISIGAGWPGVWLAVTSISFDISVLELFWTMTRGFKIVIQSSPDEIVSSGSLHPKATREHTRIDDPDAADRNYSIAAQIKDRRVTHLQCTPSLANILTADPESLEALRSLKKLLLGGEALPQSLVEQLGRKMSGEIHNMYGPTETTIWSSTGLVDKGGSRISIGQPIANTDIHILDKYLQTSPVGVPGEVFIGGAGVVRGYLDRAELTAERFTPHPFTHKNGARLYRTGDRACYLEDGRIEFLGRTDFQVKIRGHRIELKEIEAILASHPAVRESIVALREDSRGEPRLIAYVVTDRIDEPIKNELRNFLTQKLPAYMIPAAFISLNAFPLTLNGKIDRRALPAPDRAKLGLEKALVSPRNVLEESLIAIWADVLGLERIGIEDNFFELGGHSLLASKLISRLRETFQMEFPLRKFFEAPTIAGMSAAMVSEPLAKVKVERIAELYLSVARFSDDEVDRMLSQNTSL
jgi:non-ribosomal peptide synthetase component F/acyl carrier protein